MRLWARRSLNAVGFCVALTCLSDELLISLSYFELLLSCFQLFSTLLWLVLKRKDVQIQRNTCVDQLWTKSWKLQVSPLDGPTLSTVEGTITDFMMNLQIPPRDKNYDCFWWQDKELSSLIFSCSWPKVTNRKSAVHMSSLWSKVYPNILSYDSRYVT